MVAYGSDADTPFMFLSLELFVEAAALVYPSVLYFLQHSCRLSMGFFLCPSVLLCEVVQAVFRLLIF